MSEKSGPYEKARGQMRLSERIAAEIPSFRGYKEKELRRESDKLIRNQLYRKLSAVKSGLRDVFQKLSDRRMFDVMTDMDRLTAKFDRVTEKVNHASYGYTGFFDVVKVEEESLDRMIEFDSKLIEEVDGLAGEVDAFKADVAKQKFETAKKHVQSLGDMVDAFEGAFDKREEVILGVN